MKNKKLSNHKLPELTKTGKDILTADVLGLKFRVHPKRKVYQYAHTNITDQWVDLSPLGLTDLIVEQKKKLKAVTSAKVLREMSKVVAYAFDEDFRANFKGNKAIEYIENRLNFIIVRETA